MDKIISKLEAVFTKWLDEFENKPVSTGLKTLILFWILKEVSKQIKK